LFTWSRLKRGGVYYVGDFSELRREFRAPLERANRIVIDTNDTVTPVSARTDALMKAVIRDCGFKETVPVDVFWTSEARSEEPAYPDRVVVHAKQQGKHVLVAAYRRDKLWHLYEMSIMYLPGKDGERRERWVIGRREYDHIPTDHDLQDLLQELGWNRAAK
jgi:hypothetical protein